MGGVKASKLCSGGRGVRGEGREEEEEGRGGEEYEELGNNF